MLYKIYLQNIYIFYIYLLTNTDIYFIYINTIYIFYMGADYERISNKPEYTS